MSEEKVAELKVLKSPEEIKAEEEKVKKEREARFYKDPFSFVETKDLIVATMRTSTGLAVYRNLKAQRIELELSQARIQRLCDVGITAIEIAVAKNKRIVVPGQKPGGMMNFVRKKFR